MKEFQGLLPFQESFIIPSATIDEKSMDLNLVNKIIESFKKTVLTAKSLTYLPKITAIESKDKDNKK